MSLRNGAAGRVLCHGGMACRSAWGQLGAKAPAVPLALALELALAPVLEQPARLLRLRRLHDGADPGVAQHGGEHAARCRIAVDDEGDGLLDVGIQRAHGGISVATMPQRMTWIKTSCGAWPARRVAPS